MKLVKAFLQTFEGDYDQTVEIFFVTKGENLYCLNQFVNERRFYGKTDVSVSGWCIKGNEDADIISKCPVRGENYEKVEMDLVKAQDKFDELARQARLELEEPGQVYIDGSFELVEYSRKKDRNSLDMDGFRELFL